MKKRFITLGAAAIATAGVLAGCGGAAGTEKATTRSTDETIETVVTAQSVAEKVVENMEAVNSYSFKEELKTDFKVSAGGENMGIKMNINLDGDGVVKPEQVAHINANVDAEMTGDENMKIKSEIYVLEEDGKYVSYSKIEDDEVDEKGWTKSENETIIDLNKINNANIYKQIAEGKIEAELSEGEKVNGRETYKLTAKVPGEVFQEAYSAMGGSSILEGLGDLDFTKASADSEMYIYKDTLYPARIYVDAKEYGEKLYKQAMEEASGLDGIEVKVNAFDVDLTMDNYNAIDKIEIPAEVKETAKSATE